MTDSPPDEEDRDPMIETDQERSSDDTEPEDRHRPDNDGETVPE